MTKEISPKDKIEFLNLIKSSKLAVVDFFADWCGPCKTLKPKLEEFALANPSITFYAVDVDKSSALASAIGIRSMPTIIFYLNGEEYAKVIGLDLLGIQKHLASLSGQK
jgi:thioredoxin 1